MLQFSWHGLRKLYSFSRKKPYKAREHGACRYPWIFLCRGREVAILACNQPSPQCLEPYPKIALLTGEGESDRSASTCPRAGVRQAQCLGPRLSYWAWVLPWQAPALPWAPIVLAVLPCLAAVLLVPSAVP